jgi:hypothetical protein
MHGYENSESAQLGSWRTYRYDHIFASQALSAQSIAYLYSLHEHRLSDNVPIEAVFAPKTALQMGEVARQCVRESYEQSDETRRDEMR